VKMFSHLICFIQALCKFYTFSAVCKDNTFRICITMQRKKYSSPATLTDHNTLVIFIKAQTSYF
jgi:hypothetical protein